MNQESPAMARPTKTDVRKAGLKNLGSFVVMVFLLVSGLSIEIKQACLWPSYVLSDILSGRWQALIPLFGFVGSIIWLSIMIGWVIPLPNSLFMIVTGRESRSLAKLFPVFFRASESMSARIEKEEKEEEE